MPRHRLTSLARTNRQRMTKAERKFWNAVRAKRIGFKFRRQVPLDNYIVDFLCEEGKLIVELDGVQHKDQKDEDAERTQVLESMGYLVHRVWNIDVTQNLDGVIAGILNILNKDQ